MSTPDNRPALPDNTLPEFDPVPRKRMRRGGWSAERQREFIALLAETGTVRDACRRMGAGEHHIYKLRAHPEGASFARAWEAALDLGVRRVEDTLMDRAINGVEVPVYHRGEIVGTRRVFNDRLLMFVLAQRMPEKYGKGAGHSGTLGPAARRRLKAEWRAEWEAEQAAKHVSPAEVRASIDRKVEALHRQVHARQLARWIALAPETRAALRHYHTLLAADPGATGDSALPDWAVDEEAVEAELAKEAQRGGGDAGADRDDGEGAGQHPPEGWNRAAEGKPDESGPRTRSLRDDGWE
ncbi:hypothetical protein QQS45_10705 [Alteriqipengyuania flavescens]|uniref:hypothetical protein n=1 Tax=Alteriqipengyuania flavescens TaxID=3053610 RepID=UPI0025B394C5|nr:hypothetical protein [Alteriqipengyuania flavescens]WJY18088.1 hypothetical protein QQW98_10700 [Alteriqipengyuania flavescens]WJY24029.1 hypothetical protein QQS45_10705 [Alteriqipengyuania flavescens]